MRCPAAVFAFAHWGSGFVTEFVVMTFVFGLASAWLLRRAKSLWPSVMAHFAYNSIVIVVGVIEAGIVGWGVTLT